ncbi:transmembrane protein, putative (macronuclear) [Tetrahymena thermophila SB210]|uniref:Transmembrane protein, putative n=1 Tax=Tetrahymena thermophila (strain SB210) TaxID=312017 RepID=W7X815_TETTS|nr:transmembrane protein, putative [Tetrahymena thermophila SB210]EWS72568.1 transmembrane protein, putative [Tetrahymena thermophila SB210]|eukprot:XP_012654851.1 transmembrane protein, putative [Tetrahymena thermophila SB210]
MQSQSYLILINVILAMIQIINVGYQLFIAQENKFSLNQLQEAIKKLIQPFILIKSMIKSRLSKSIRLTSFKMVLKTLIKHLKAMKALRLLFSIMDVSIYYQVKIGMNS